MSFVNEIPINQVIEAEPEELAPSLLRYLKKQDNISRYTIISYTDARASLRTIASNICKCSRRHGPGSNGKGSSRLGLTTIRVRL